MNGVSIDIATGEQTEVTLSADEIAGIQTAAAAQINPRINEIKDRLDQTDRDAMRPLRAVLVGTATQDDHDKLTALEQEAVRLRDELRGLV